MKGKFIAIEGPDGSGKETQQKLLIARLRKNGYSVEPFDFPQYESSLFGELVGQMLSETYGPMDNIHPRIASVVYAADRWSASPKINDHLLRGDIIVANRYTLSNDAHQSARLPEAERDAFLKWLEDLEYSSLGFGIPRPDLYIHLDVPPEISQELILQKAERAYLEGKGGKDALEKNAAHQIEAARMYRKLADSVENIVTVSCTNDRNGLMEKGIIHELVWSEVEKSILNDPEAKVSRERGN